MTGDHGADGDGTPRTAGARPSFLPPIDGYPPPEPAYEPSEPPEAPAPYGEPPPARPGRAWDLASIAAAAVLLVSAFLPWAQARMVVDLFDRPVGRDLGTVAGIEADDLVIAVPVLALIAIGLAFWDLAARDPRISALGAVPGLLSLLACGLFLFRLDGVRDDLPSTGLGVGYEIGVRYGWYVAVATSLLVIGFSLARPISARLGSRARQGAEPSWDGAQWQSAQWQGTGWENAQWNPAHTGQAASPHQPSGEAAPPAGDVPSPGAVPGAEEAEGPEKAAPAAEQEAPSAAEEKPGLTKHTADRSPAPEPQPERDR
ncbi:MULTISPECIES: hypothetical protein [Actinomadura]|uniref:DNA translocase FtsK 4TM region domain-containing protein n=1 Tax=Actinomadura yumaensis TaxID=111807 RepID=A0ABW2CI39_9ACTN|nr:hypothetical protein [Actinomadura sp. J1-007]MWK33092.1 hypothetical protein [Actinomadura sp. J1-007]